MDTDRDPEAISDAVDIGVVGRRFTNVVNVPSENPTARSAATSASTILRTATLRFASPRPVRNASQRRSPQGIGEDHADGG